MFTPSLNTVERRQIESAYVLFPERVVYDAKDFVLTNVLTQKRVQLSDYQKGRQAVILVFWDADDPRCQQVLQYLEDIHGYCMYYATQIIGVCSDPPDAQRAAAKAHDTDFPLLYDAGGAVLEAYHVNVYPTVMIVDPFGKRQEKYRGGCPEQIGTLRLVSQMTGFKYLSPEELKLHYLGQTHGDDNEPKEEEGGNGQ
jgi:peroxiredoxin